MNCWTGTTRIGITSQSVRKVQKVRADREWGPVHWLARWAHDDEWAAPSTTASSLWTNRLQGDPALCVSLDYCSHCSLCCQVAGQTAPARRRFSKLSTSAQLEMLESKVRTHIKYVLVLPSLNVFDLPQNKQARCGR